MERIIDLFVIFFPLTIRFLTDFFFRPQDQQIEYGLDHDQDQLQQQTTGISSRRLYSSNNNSHMIMKMTRLQQGSNLIN